MVMLCHQLHYEITCYIQSLQFGRTEHIMNTLNPKFVKKFVLDFYFEEKQELRFEL